MLHHTNVDRLWAYWQAIHPEHASFRLPYKGGARFSTPGGTIIGPDSPLRPFFKSETELHSTRSVEKISDFGYAYQGLEYWEKSEAQMKVEAKILINQLYGPTDTNSRLLPRQDVNGTIRYFANVQLEASEVERPCVVELFIGDVRAGSMFVMENPAKGFVHAGFPLDNTLEVAGMRDLLLADTLNAIQSSLQVSIVKVGRFHLLVQISCRKVTNE
jgi:tyrosinase